MESPLTGVAAVFLKNEDLIDQRCSEFKMCSLVANCIGADQLIGCQRIGKLWRIYPRSSESRLKLLTQDLKVENQQVHVYGDNPFRAGIRDPNQEVTRITVKDLPLSKGNTGLQKFMEGYGVKLTRAIEYCKARDPSTHILSDWYNGDRLCYAENLAKPLPRSAKIGDLTVRIFHRGQEADEKKKLCTNCYSKDHFRKQCTNPPACVRCQKPGHMPGDPACIASTPAPQDFVTVQGQQDTLSSFFPCKIKVFGISARSGEHAYQYSKAIRRGQLDIANGILESRSAAAAKAQSKFLKRDDSWKDERVAVMRQVLQAKVQQVPSFK